MVKVFLKFIIGVLSIPVAFGVSVAFRDNILLIKEISGRLDYFVWGIAAYAILHLVFYKPTFLYVLGHEAVHAGTAWLFGGRVKSFKVSKEGGSVAADKSNVVIELSPYFIPIYAIVIMLIYFLVSTSYTVNSSLFVFLVGFAMAFHIISTIEVMKVKQPDIVKSGYLFSIVLVYVLNIIVVALLFSLLFPAFSAKAFFINTWHVSNKIYVSVVQQLFF